MVTSDAETAWKRLGLGLRSSSGFRLGTVLLAICVTVQLTLLYVPAASWKLPAFALLVPWWLFALTLLVLGVCYVSLTVRPFFGSGGVLPGAAHLLQAFFMLFVLRGTREIFYFAPFLPLLKYGALAGFALLDRHYLTDGTRRLILAIAVAETLKIMARTYEILPTLLARPIDAALVLLQVLALWRLAADVTYEEDVWARSLLGSAGATFADHADTRGEDT